MIEFRSAKDSAEDILAIQALYERSFPANERRPLEPLLEDETGHARVLSICREGEFCGFLCLLEANGLVHIIYFAVEEGRRGRGIGSGALAEMRRRNPGKRILVDIEQVCAGADNNEQRQRRKEFYLRNGYDESPVEYAWRGTRYIVMSSGGAILNDEFWQFWKDLCREMPAASIY